MTINHDLEAPASRPAKRKPSRLIILEVSAAYGVSATAILGPSHERWIVKARCEAMRKVAAEWEWLSYPCIGRLFNKDHKSVMHHVSRSSRAPKCACHRQHGNTHKPTTPPAE
jgi:chromosomal replication initiation ATPase DnaA